MIFNFEFDHSPEHSALLVVDMQNNYVAGKEFGLPKYLEHLNKGSTDYYLDRVNVTVVPAIRALLHFFRRRAMPVVYVYNHIDTEDASDWNPITREQMLRAQAQTGIRRIFPVGTFEHEIAENVKPLKGDIVIPKKAQDAFATSGIDRVLRNMNVESLFITGVITEGCVASTARGAFNNGYKTVIVEDGCATLRRQIHEATNEIFASMCGEVMGSDRVMSILSASEKSA